MALPQLDMTIKMNQLIYIIICILLSLSIQAQDIEKIDIETQVEKVTVFFGWGTNSSFTSRSI